MENFKSFNENNNNQKWEQSTKEILVFQDKRKKFDSLIKKLNRFAKTLGFPFPKI